ncbi:hypothetical protein K2X92_03855 [Candidatus Gracilibacteria bacterium]|nr:hypothetical protein [Candidatus Gracilibacteria bacterium]
MEIPDYISSTPIDIYRNRFSLLEIDDIIPGIKDRIFKLLNIPNNEKYVLEQSAIINDMIAVGLAPKNIYISDEDREGISQLSNETDLETFMMYVGLHKASNPELPFDQPYSGPQSGRKKKIIGSGNKKGFLWDKSAYKNTSK